MREKAVNYNHTNFPKVLNFWKAVFEVKKIINSTKVCVFTNQKMLKVGSRGHVPRRRVAIPY
jgi:hypothetical protein